MNKKNLHGNLQEDSQWPISIGKAVHHYWENDNQNHNEIPLHMHSVE